VVCLPSFIRSSQPCHRVSSRVIAKECRVHMGRDLMLEFPSFLENIRSMDRVLKTLEHAPSWSIEGKLTHIKPFTKSEPY
jgi:hypothetical protein